ncbi:MAG: DEAD/DEAH box helicase [Lachnospiraceae bacterium]|nr:DEAD/DEAH box helicase [Muribaculaceae bacterium]MCM1411093.1 DEAD/DEAH box helicase [Lachnospiraceae bacterium]
MRYEPHEYQMFAAEYIKSHEVSAVLLECGLGKTSITLTAINDLMFDSFDIHKVLVIAPIRVAKMSWSDEIEKWDHISDLKYSVAVGTETERIKALKESADIYLINRENVQWLVEKSGITFDFDMVVVDELSSFKNWQAKRFKALMKVRPKLKRIVGLTGTPSSNGLMDLFAEYKLLDMGERLGRFIGQYRNLYFRPDKMNGNIVYSYKLLPGAEDAIYNRISDITISMKSADYLKMPNLVNSRYTVHLDKQELLKYAKMREELILKLPKGEVTAANAAALSGKLTQMANGAVYSDDGDYEKIHDRKLDALEDIIESANGNPVLVAYWYQHDLERIQERLAELKVDFARLDKDQNIRSWNKGDVSVGLIHPASAGHGLNLQSGGNILVWFGLTWSLELYQQTVDRLWRQGQKNTVSVIHIVAAKTIDEQIMRALETKDHTQKALINAVKAEVVMDGS